MAYLPLILLILAAFTSGAAVLFFLIALRSQREQEYTIFPVIREVEALKAKWARLGVAVFSILAALTIGGWMATQRGPVDTATSSIALFTPPQNQEARISLADLLISSEPNMSQPQAEIALATATPPVVVATPTHIAITNDSIASIVPTNTSSPLPMPTETTATPSATFTPLPTATPTPTPTMSPTPSPSSTATPLPSTATSSPPLLSTTPLQPTGIIPTRAEIVTAEIDAIAPVPAEQISSVAINPSEGFLIGPIVFSTEITRRRKAVNPRIVFGPTDKRIYAVYPYKGMQNGMTFTVIWYHQDREIIRDESEWTWGSIDLSYVYIEPNAIGNYRVEMQVEGHPIASASFDIKP